MNKSPINERLLILSLPGFDELTEKEMERIKVTSFEYDDFTALTTAELHFTYADRLDRANALKYELSGNRDANEYYHHVMYEIYTIEKEFLNVRKAIDYLEQMAVNASSSIKEE